MARYDPLYVLVGTFDVASSPQIPALRFAESFAGLTRIQPSMYLACLADGAFQLVLADASAFHGSSLAL